MPESITLENILGGSITGFASGCDSLGVLFGYVYEKLGMSHTFYGRLVYTGNTELLSDNLMKYYAPDRNSPEYKIAKAIVFCMVLPVSLPTTIIARASHHLGYHMSGKKSSPSIVEDTSFEKAPNNTYLNQ